MENKIRMFRFLISFSLPSPFQFRLKIIYKILNTVVFALFAMFVIWMFPSLTQNSYLTYPTMKTITS